MAVSVIYNRLFFLLFFFPKNIFIIFSPDFFSLYPPPTRIFAKGYKHSPSPLVYFVGLLQTLQKQIRLLSQISFSISSTLLCACINGAEELRRGVKGEKIYNKINLPRASKIEIICFFTLSHRLIFFLKTFSLMFIKENRAFSALRFFVLTKIPFQTVNIEKSLKSFIYKKYIQLERGKREKFQSETE